MHAGSPLQKNAPIFGNVFTVTLIIVACILMTFTQDINVQYHSYVVKQLKCNIRNIFIKIGAFFCKGPTTYMCIVHRNTSSTFNFI